MKPATPRLLVLSQLFPSVVLPNAGLFIRERMFRVGRRVPIVILSPQPWFPLQALIRLVKPHFRPTLPRYEVQDGIEIHRPRFFCIPGIGKRMDGLFMALGAWWTARKLVRRDDLNIIDAHFAYPDGYAATVLGKWLRLPVMITLRGKEEKQMRTVVAGPLRTALRSADRLVAVSEALRQVALRAGARPDTTTVIGNGVDLVKFQPVQREEARRQLDLPAGARVLISVGGLVEGKGFHRVIEVLPALCARFPDLYYLIVGGPTIAGDMTAALKAQVAAAKLEARVRFLGPYPQDRLKIPYSAADVFVLATGYEGWANVFLEAMACGLPVVTTRVGGNAQVVSSDALGTLVAFGDPDALRDAIAAALMQHWNRDAIMVYARQNSWDDRVAGLLREFEALLASDPSASASARISGVRRHNAAR